MRKIKTGIISAGLCAALIASGMQMGQRVKADEAETTAMETVTVDTKDIETQVGDVEADGTEQLGQDPTDLLSALLLGGTVKRSEPTKEETVYVIADAEGGAQKVIVSDWIKNVQKSEKLNDRTELANVENVKGDETFTADGNDCVWDAKGADISYQGTTNKEVPVGVKITYELDGQVVTPQELHGRSGHVVMRFDYENKTKQEVTVGGKKENMYVPFLMLTGVILDDDRFTNITAPGCKLINDGSRTVAIGIALPGLQENLGIDPEKIAIPESLVIEADVKEFSLAMTVTVATNEMFGNLANLDIKDLDTLSASMEQLTNGMDQLCEGAGTLRDSLKTLQDKSGDLESGVVKLADGSVALKNGLAQANTGAGQLSEGAGALKDGADQLKSGADALAEGVGKLADGTAQVDAGAAQLSDGAGKLQAGLDTLAGNNESLMGGAGQVFDSLLATAEKQLKEAGAEIPKLTKENYASVLDATADTLKKGAAAYAQADPQTAAVYQAKAQTVAELKASLDGYNTFYAGLKNYTDGVAESAKGAGSLKTGVDSLKDGLGSVKEGATALKDGADTLKGGMQDLDEGAATLKTGADSLKDGTGSLLAGADQLSGGLGELKSNIPALKVGVLLLYNGSSKLADGLNEFNEKGIEQLTQAVEGELQGLIERTRAMGSLSAEYYNFAGIADGMKGQVKFIIRTDEI